MIHMRNKLTSEIRDVEPESEEFYELQEQVTPNGQPMWEQTNKPHADAIRDRADHDELLEEDLGHEHQNELLPAAIRLDLEGVAPERNPHLQLTPGEIEAGLTPQQKLEDLKQQYDDSVIGHRREVFDSAAEQIAGSDRSGPRQAEGGESRGQLARAGGSDDRDNVPRPDASDRGGNAGNSGEGKHEEDAAGVGSVPPFAGTGDE